MGRAWAYNTQQTTNGNKLFGHENIKQENYN